MLRSLPEDPTVEEVHEVRTGTRRVESALRGLALDSSRNERTLLEGLKQIRARAGKVRDMDVLMSHVLEQTIAAESGCVIRLAHHLGARRYRQASKLHSLVKREGTQLRRRLKAVERRIQRIAEKAAATEQYTSQKSRNSKDEPLLHMVALVLRLSQELAAIRRLGANNLHSYRVEVKRLRYLLEMADVDAGSKTFVDELKSVQDSIGEWHDWAALHSIANDLLRHHRCNLIAQIQRVEEQKFQLALKTAEQMRKRYLQFPPGNAKRPGRDRRKVKAAIPLPTLTASAQIAA